jgi:protein AFG1
MNSFDELQLVDATSAAMLRDVLSWYWRMGGIIIATSVSPHTLDRSRRRTRTEPVLILLESITRRPIPQRVTEGPHELVP